MSMSMVTFFRVQSTRPYEKDTNKNNSLEKIIVENNRPKFKTKSWIYIGDAEHMPYFLRKRLDVKYMKELYQSGERKDFAKKGVYVLEMAYPYWVGKLLENYAVDDKAARREGVKARNKTLPLLVDKLTPGRSFGISTVWASLLELCCLDIKRHDVSCKRDYTAITSYRETLQAINELDYKEIGKALIRCKVSFNDIAEIEKRYQINFGVITKTIRAMLKGVEANDFEESPRKRNPRTCGAKNANL